MADAPAAGDDDRVRAGAGLPRGGEGPAGWHVHRCRVADRAEHSGRVRLLAPWDLRRTFIGHLLEGGAKIAVE